MTAQPPRARASNRPGPKLDASVDRRLRNLQATLNDLQRALEMQSKRTAAIQAQVDHLDAKMRGH